jgi:hypothetical protein
LLLKLIGGYQGMKESQADQLLLLTIQTKRRKEKGRGFRVGDWV